MSRKSAKFKLKCEDFDLNFKENVTEIAQKAYNCIDHDVQDEIEEPAKLQEIVFGKLNY